MENFQISTKFSECLGGNKYSTGERVRYSVLLVTSCCKLWVLLLKADI